MKNPHNWNSRAERESYIIITELQEWNMKNKNEDYSEEYQEDKDYTCRKIWKWISRWIFRGWRKDQWRWTRIIG